MVQAENGEAEIRSVDPNGHKLEEDLLIVYFSLLLHIYWIVRH